MAFKFSQRSLTNLAGVHPNMINVVKRALEISPVDFMVIEGVRTKARQHTLYGEGRTPAELAKVGLPASLSNTVKPKVTWTLDSNHFLKADGYGHAVDLLPAPYDWKQTGPFDQVARSMFEAARQLGIKIRWGADWDRDGKWRERGESDSPHFELDR